MAMFFSLSFDVFRKRKKRKNEITGALIYYPNYEETSHADGSIFLSEEVIAIDNLSRETIISKDLENCVPFISNRDETAFKKSS